METIKLFELKKIQSDFEQRKITDSRGAYNFIKQFYSDDIEIFESAFILLLNKANVTTGYAKISQGGVAGTVIDPKIVAKYAVDALASGIILAHNHPSGNKMPSEADKAITKRIKSGLALLDIDVMDHIILTTETYYSFADEGMI